MIDRWGTKSPCGSLVIEPRASTEYTKVATKTPRVTWLPRSRTKFRIMRGPNCCDARVSARIVIENTTPTTVITAAAMAMSTWRPASALPVRIHDGSVEVPVVRGQIDLEGHHEEQARRRR